MWKFIRCSATSLLLLLCADLLVGAVINHQSAPAENSRYAHVYIELEHVNDASSTFTAKVTATLLDYKLPTTLHRPCRPYFAMKALTLGSLRLSSFPSASSSARSS